jgi:hypothetical protein
LNLTCDEALSNFDSNFNMCLYRMVPDGEGDGRTMSDESEEELPRVWAGVSGELVERINARPYIISFTSQLNLTAGS